MTEEATTASGSLPPAPPEKSIEAKPSFPRSSPYWPVLTHKLLRRVLPGIAVSAFGDGMAVVAISWLALELAPAGSRPFWVALAIAAYSLPATLGAVIFGRFLAVRGSMQLVYWDATLRGVCLGLIPVAHLLGVLTPPLFVALIAASSVLHSWGSAGRFTLVAEVLPERQHMPANALLIVFGEAASIAGPPVAGLLIAWQGAVLVIALDAASFLALAVTFRLALRSGVSDAPAEAPKRRSPGLRAIVRDRTLLTLLTLTFVFFLLFGPVYVALPIHVVDDLHGSAGLLGLYYTAFGGGALIGAVMSGYAGRLPLWRTLIGIVVGFGACLLPMGLGAPVFVSLAAFAVGGFIWAPYMSISRALFQRWADQDSLATVLAAQSAVIVPAVPLGTMLGGPLVAHLTAQGTLLACAVATVVLGGVSAVVIGGLTWAGRQRGVGGSTNSES